MLFDKIFSLFYVFLSCLPPFDMAPRMSVLFEALHKAAQDYRAQKSPMDVPIVSVVPSSSEKKAAGIRIGALAFMIIAGLGGYGFLYHKPAPTFPPLGQTSIEPIAPTPTQPSASLGITVPSEQLQTPSSKTDQEEIEEQLRSVPALSIETGEGIALDKEDFSPESKIVVTTTARQNPDLQKAQKAIEQKAWGQAIYLYEKILKNEPTSTIAMEGKALALSQRGQVEDLSELNEMIETKPDLPNLHVAKARFLASAGRLPEAVESWSKAVSLSPDTRDYRLGLAILYDQMGEEVKAIQQYTSIPHPLPREAQARLDYLRSMQTARKMVKESFPSLKQQENP